MDAPTVIWEPNSGSMTAFLWTLAFAVVDGS